MVERKRERPVEKPEPVRSGTVGYVCAEAKPL